MLKSLLGYIEDNKSQDFDENKVNNLVSTIKKEVESISESISNKTGIPKEIVVYCICSVSYDMVGNYFVTDRDIN